eukprot:606718-Hanusia_phi.AAC.2
MSYMKTHRLLQFPRHVNPTSPLPMARKVRRIWLVFLYETSMEVREFPSSHVAASCSTTVYQHLGAQETIESILFAQVSMQIWINTCSCS